MLAFIKSRPMADGRFGLLGFWRGRSIFVSSFFLVDFCKAVIGFVFAWKAMCLDLDAAERESRGGRFPRGNIAFAFRSMRLWFSGKRNLAISFVSGVSAGRFAGDRPSLQLSFAWVQLVLIVWPPAKMLSDCSALWQGVSGVPAEIASYVCAWSVIALSVLRGSGFACAGVSKKMRDVSAIANRWMVAAMNAGAICQFRKRLAVPFCLNVRFARGPLP